MSRCLELCGEYYRVRGTCKNIIKYLTGLLRHSECLEGVVRVFCECRHSESLPGVLGQCTVLPQVDLKDNVIGDGGTESLTGVISQTVKHTGDTRCLFPVLPKSLQQIVENVSPLDLGIGFSL